MYNQIVKIFETERQLVYENEVLKAVWNIGVDVNKEELLKALKYDRDQYNEGYQDGLNADKWIPCSERLPEESVEVLVCAEVGSIWVCSLEKKALTVSILAVLCITSKRVPNKNGLQ